MLVEDSPCGVVIGLVTQCSGTPLQMECRGALQLTKDEVIIACYSQHYVHLVDSNTGIEARVQKD